jgi:hypothetical protein
MATTAAETRGRLVAGVFAIAKPVYLPKVCSLFLCQLRISSIDSQVVINTSEFEKRAAAKAEKDRKAKDRAKGKAKGVVPIAGSSKPSKVVLRESLLFSSQCPLRLT